MSDPDSFNELLKRHRPMVWRMCWISAHGNYERCRDLVQEVSIALWRHFDQLRPDATLQEERAWVRWQTRSVLDFQRRMQRPAPLPLTPGMADMQAADDILEQQEELEELMSTLNDDERRMLRLQLEGYRADEIAEAMGLKRDAVYQRLHRVVGKMRRVALLLVLLCLAVTVAVAVVPQWREQVFSRTEEEEKPEEEAVSPTEIPSPTPVVPLEVPVDTVAPRQAWIPPEPLPHLNAPADTSLPDLPARKPEVGIAYNDGKLILTGLVDGELVVIRNPKGVLVALKRTHGSTCTIELTTDRLSYSTYILQIGNRPDRIRIDL
ncbi:MAG: sigma-70 family RNA polymerase sigma factor [Bacteroidales bacterium]|nr:sigma-70 family RNA polymerase sigma factor [Bacteroidales bacterium]